MSAPTKQVKKSSQNKPVNKAQVAVKNTAAATDPDPAVVAAEQTAQLSAKGAQNAARAAERQAAREAELAERMERRAKAEAAARRQQTTRKLIGAGFVALLIVAGIVGFMWFQDTHPGESFADQGNQHITIGQTHPAYNSDPPTSGWHSSDLAGWGFFSDTPATERMIHNLEDGGVNIYYQPNIDSATLDKLKSLVGSYPSQVALTKYENLNAPIVATAWTRLEKFNGFDDASIRKFIKAYRGIDHHVTGQG